MKRRVLLAVNEHARRGQAAREHAVAALREAGHDVTVMPLERDRNALTSAIAAQRDRIDVVALGGGDGTLVAGIEGVLAARVPLLILPLGTVNELARTLAIPFDIKKACALLDDGRLKAIDLGRVNGRPFLNEASIGLSTHVARNETEELKGRWGMLSVPIATLRALRAMRPYRLHVQTEDGTRTFRTVQLTVANSHRFGGFVENKDARLGDGRLDLYSIDVRGWRDGLAVVASVALRRFPNADCVTNLRGQRFVVDSRRRHRVYTDGEAATSTPAEFTMLEHAIDVFVPQETAE